MESGTELLGVGQYNLIYNAFSFTFATMAAATLFFWLGRAQVQPAYKTASPLQVWSQPSLPTITGEFLRAGIRLMTSLTEQ